MIEITRIKNERNENIGFRCFGHAGFARHGKDIVCASISSIVYTTINAIEKIRLGSIEVIDKDDMQINILTDDEIVNLLIENMFDLFNEIAKTYPKNVSVKES